MKIRTAISKDHDSIYDLVKIAFQTAEVSNGKEQDFVVDLRSTQGYIEELELVIEENDELIGHIILTEHEINLENSKIIGLYLAPVCVKQDYRRKGYGAELIEKSLKKAQKLGYTSVFLVGNPEYYSKFGFRKTSDFNIYNSNGIPEEVCLALELKPKSLRNLRGTIDF